jgi:hypothetical protein
MYILKEGANAQIFKPSWDKTVTTVRPLYGPNPERDENGNLTHPGEWDPYRIDPDDPMGFGDHMQRYDMVFSLGIPGITFITQSPYDPVMDIQQHPVMKLRSAMYAAAEQRQMLPDWGALLSNNRRLPKIKDGYVMRCIVMEKKSKAYSDPPGWKAEHPETILLIQRG